MLIGDNVYTYDGHIGIIDKSLDNNKYKVILLNLKNEEIGEKVYAKSKLKYKKDDYIPFVDNRY